MTDSTAPSRAGTRLLDLAVAAAVQRDLDYAEAIRLGYGEGEGQWDANYPPDVREYVTAAIEAVSDWVAQQETACRSCANFRDMIVRALDE